MSGSKRALVTGACGFVAGYVIEALLKNGWEVKATDLKTANKASLEKFGEKVPFSPSDVTDKDSLKLVVKDVDIVFHTAAIFDFSTPIEILRAVNVQGTRNVIEVSMDADVKKMVCWSSTAVYGQADPKWYKIPITEDQELNPMIKNRYDLSKREQEEAALTYYNENNFPVTLVRCNPIYGPGSYYGMYVIFYYTKIGALPAMPRNLHNYHMPIVHIEDIAGAALYLSDVKNYNGEAYNITDDNDLDTLETARYVAFLTGSRLKVLLPVALKPLRPLLRLLGKMSLWEAKHLRKKVNGKPPVPKLETETFEYLYGKYWFSNEKLKATGYKLKYPDRRIGLIKTIDWYDEHGWEPLHH